MAIVEINAICSGVQNKVSRKTGKPYQVTAFLEWPSLVPLQVFGDIAPADPTPKLYRLEGAVNEMSEVVVLSGASPAKK